MKQPDCAVRELSGRKFTWYAGTGCIERSDLPDFSVGQIWSDSCDVGFWIRSHRTGQRVLFTFVGEQKSGEGEILWATYTSHGLANPVTVTVFND